MEAIYVNVGDLINVADTLGKFSLTYNHVHFTSREHWDYIDPNWPCLYTNNPLDPSFSSAWRFECLQVDSCFPYPGYYYFTGAWAIFPDQQFGENQQLDPSNVNPYLTPCIDILLEVYELTAYPSGSDNNNGVYALDYVVGVGPPAYNRLKFEQWYGNNWNLNYIYETTRCQDPYNNPPYRHTYVITNTMSGNDCIDISNWGIGLHTIDIYAKDEQGNEWSDVIFLNITNIKEETSPNTGLSFTLKEATIFKNKLIVKYILPSKSRVELLLFDVTGRCVAMVVSNEVRRRGYHTEIYPIKLPSGIYFLILRNEGNVIKRKLLNFN